MKWLIIIAVVILLAFNPMLLLAVLPLGIVALLALVFIRPFLTRSDARRVAVYAASKAYQRYKR